MTTERTRSDLQLELEEFEQALTTPWAKLTQDQMQMVRASPLLVVSGKTLDRAATFNALREWLA